MRAMNGSERLGHGAPRPGVIELPSLEQLSIRRRVEKVLKVVRRIIGVPDYECYLKHSREHHPGEKTLTRKEFERERLIAKYQRPGSRCC